MTEQELCMRHQGGYQKKVDCWFCKSEEEQAKIMERIFKTNQEGIREGMKKLRGTLRDECLFGNDDYVINTYLNYLRSQGVVIKVERELSDTIPTLCVINLKEGRGYPNCMAGLTAWEPLIKEEK